MRILVSGGSGFIGRALVNRLLKSHHSVWVYTHKKNFINNLDFVKNVTVITNTDFFPDVDIIVNLSGEAIDKYPLTKSRLKKILSSRIDTLEILKNKYSNRLPNHLLQASATGIYIQGKNIDENSSIDNTVYSNLCYEIEKKAKNIPCTGVTLLRLGVVIGDNGGLVRNLKYLPRPYIIDGNNKVPYICLDDCVKAILFTIENKIYGPVNLCCDNFLNVNEILKLCKPNSFLNIPCLKPLLKLDKRAQLLLTNQEITPKKLIENGFVFTKFK